MVKQSARRSLDINLLELQKGLEKAYPFSFGDKEMPQQEKEVITSNPYDSDTDKEDLQEYPYGLKEKGITML